MLDFPNSPAAGDRFNLDSVVYEWDGQKWNVEGYSPPYELIVRGEAVLTTGFVFDPYRAGAVQASTDPNNQPGPPATVGGPVNRWEALQGPPDYRMRAITSGYMPTLDQSGLIKFDGVDDSIGGPGDIPLLMAEPSVYVCMYIVPKAPLVARRIAYVTRANASFPKLEALMNPDGTLAYRPDGQVPIPSVTTKLTWGVPQVVEVQYGCNTDQMVGFAIDGGAIEQIPSGLPAGVTSGQLSKNGGGIAPSGFVGRFIVSGRIPSTETRKAFIEWCRGSN